MAATVVVEMAAAVFEAKQQEQHEQDNEKYNTSGRRHPLLLSIFSDTHAYTHTKKHAQSIIFFSSGARPHAPQYYQ